MKNVKNLKVQAEGMQIDEIIKPAFLKKIKNKFSGCDVRFAEIAIIILDKNDKRKDKKKNQKSEKTKSSFIRFVHRGELDYQDKKVVISSSDVNTLKKMLCD